MSTEAQESAFTEVQESAYKAGLIRFHQGDKVIGAGFYTNGYILTCAHVITQGLNLGTKPSGVAVDSVANKPVKVDFPFVAAKQFQNAEIVPDLRRFNDQDLAVLKILEAIPEGVAPLSVKEDKYYRKHRYHVYGFPDGHPDGVWAQGEIGGELTRGWVQMEGTRAEGLAIEPGFSGAPVWDETLEGIAGMTVARDKDREEAKVGFMIPYKELKLVLEAITLFDLLLPEADNLVPYWKNAYQFVRPEISRESHPLTLLEAVLQVQNMAEGGSGYRAITQFIGYLSQPKLGLDIQPKLIHWLESQGINAPSFLQEVKQKVEEQQANQPAGLSPHLLFWVQEELNSDRYSVQAYLVSDREQYDPLSAKQLKAPADFLEQSQDEKVNCETVEQILRKSLEESVAELPKEGGLPSITVNVFLPLSCLGWDVDRWSANEFTPYTPVPEPIGLRHHVVLRAAERLNKQIPGYHQMQGKWSEKWKLLNQMQSNFAHERLVPGRGETPATLYKKLSKKTEEMVGFYLVEAPVSFTDGNSSLFPVLIGSGAPLAIWLRQNLPDDCQQAFNQLLTSCFSELSINIQRLRQEADQECDDGEIHAGQHIGFIWEDPKLVPPVANIAPRFRMSV